MSFLSRSIVAALTIGAATPLLADIFSFTDTLSPPSAGNITDGDLSGLSRTQTVTTTLGLIADVSLTLTLAGQPSTTAWNGDFYAFLRHDASGTLAVLMNRLGVSDASNPGDIGYGDNGLTAVTFSDAAANDVHFYQGTQNPGGGALTGTWQPDARGPGLITGLINAEPLGTGGRLNTFSQFNGLDPNSGWTLFIADLAGGNEAQLSSWTLTLNFIPEASSIAAGALLAFLGASQWRRGAKRAGSDFKPGMSTNA